MNQDKIKEIRQKYPKGTRIMLNSMDEKELTVMKYTAEGLQKARETEDA